MIEVCTTDKQIVQKRFCKNLKTYSKNALVQQQIASRLVDLLPNSTKNNYNKILEIGCGTGFLTNSFLSSYHTNEYVLNDIVETAFQEVQQTTNNIKFNNFKFVSGDAETVNFSGKYNAVLSSSTFQWFNNLEVFICKMQDLLEANGIFAFSTFGRNNYKEIRETLNVGLEYSSLSKLEQLVGSKFEIIHSEEWLEEVNFENPMQILKHMKDTGVNGIKPCFMGKEKLSNFKEEYNKLYLNEDNTVRLSYHPIIIIARKKY